MGRVKVVLNYLNSGGVWLSFGLAASVSVIIYSLMTHRLDHSPWLVLGISTTVVFVVVFLTGYLLDDTWPYLDNGRFTEATRTFEKPKLTVVEKTQPETGLIKPESDEEFLERMSLRTWFNDQNRRREEELREPKRED